MDLLSLREKGIFDTLKKLEGLEFIVIGGYAVNAYTLPRFSVDCDLIVRDSEITNRIEERLVGFGYKKVQMPKSLAYLGKFSRYEKEIENNFKVSIDILIGEISDRQSGEVFPIEFILKNSKNTRLKGKTILETVNVLVPDVEALFTMKFASCRLVDIRDMFMIIEKADIKKLKGLIEKKEYFNKNFEKLKNTVFSEKFKNNLEGVYGYVDEKIFDRYKKLIMALGS